MKSTEALALERAALEFIASRRRKNRNGRVWTDAHAVGMAIFPVWEGPTTGRTDQAIVVLKRLFESGEVECDSPDLGSYKAKWRVTR